MFNLHPTLGLVLAFLTNKLFFNYVDLMDSRSRRAGNVGLILFAILCPLLAAETTVAIVGYHLADEEICIKQFTLLPLYLSVTCFCIWVCVIVSIFILLEVLPAGCKFVYEKIQERVGQRRTSRNRVAQTAPQVSHSINT
jgi:hypothetical protein